MSTGTRNIEYESPAIEAFYREHRTRWQHFYESERVVFESLGLTASSTVLDIGCGCGGLGLALRERFGVGSYTGVEINRQAAAAAQSVYPEGRFLHADILTVPSGDVAEHSFDVVVSLGCIDWNVQFADMLSRAYRYVKPGGHFVSSFRVTPDASQMDMRSSYQHVNFEGMKEGEIAPYVVLNVAELLQYLKALMPEKIYGYGYWGTPSPTAVTPFRKVGFVVVATRKGDASRPPVIDLNVPPELLRAALQQ